MGIRIIDANFIVKVAEHAWDEWNLAMATQDTNRGVNKVHRRQELCKAVKAVADDAPTIDPETLPVVLDHRKQLEQVTAERDAAYNDLERLKTCSLCSICENRNAPYLFCSDCKGYPHIAVDMFQWRGPAAKDKAGGAQ